MKVRHLSTVLVVGAATLIGSEQLLGAEIYKSVDSQGHVVYSDQPDPSVAQTRVEIAAPNTYSDDGVRATAPPPPLQDSEQPPCPEEGDLWTPGYWGWNGGYFWVAGEWVPPPRIGMLWTPGYWEFIDTVYVFHRGYWATYVGYYGGINYGFGYFGSGFVGGRWVGASFVYDRAAYSRSMQRQVSFHGPGGTTLAPTSQELAWAREPHVAPTSQQRAGLMHAAGLPRPAARPQVSVVQRVVSVPLPRAAAAAASPARSAQPPAVARKVTMPKATSASTHRANVSVSGPARF